MTLGRIFVDTHADAQQPHGLRTSLQPLREQRDGYAAYLSSFEHEGATR